MIRRNAGVSLVLLACMIPFERGTAQSTPQGTPDPWYARQARPRNIDPPKTFTNTFRIELPKDWQLAPGYKTTVFSVVEKVRRFEAGALITLENYRLQAPLEMPLSDAVRDYELKLVQEREVAGKQFSATLKTGPVGQIIFIQYLRPGVSGRDDHVTQYSFPVGTTKYHLICIAPAASIEKYQPIFAHVAASFTPIQPAGS